ncbi:MAG: hypothetical protein RSA53_05760 [Odoribacter sp.]
MMRWKWRMKRSVNSLLIGRSSIEIMIRMAMLPIKTSMLKIFSGQLSFFAIRVGDYLLNPRIV